MVKFLFSILTIILILSETHAFCPTKIYNLLGQCECKNEMGSPNELIIECKGDSSIDLKSIFEKLQNGLNRDEKHFKRFYLNNPAINVIKNDSFADIKFDEIVIENCYNLTTIEKDAFFGTDQVTKTLKIMFNKKLSSPDNSIWEVFSKFVIIETIQLWDTNITEIPTNAFRPLNGQQIKLNVLDFEGYNFKKLGNNAFTALKNLSSLSIQGTWIESIPENAFYFDKSNEILELYLWSNGKLKYPGYAKDSLTHFNRPTHIDLSVPPTPEYIDENVFLPFFKANNQNRIIIAHPLFNCDDCRNAWLKKSNLLNKFQYTKCSNKRELTDEQNFSNCKI